MPVNRLSVGQPPSMAGFVPYGLEERGHAEGFAAVRAQEARWVRRAPAAQLRASGRTGVLAASSGPAGTDSTAAAPSHTARPLAGVAAIALAAAAAAGSARRGSRKPSRAGQVACAAKAKKKKGGSAKQSALEKALKAMENLEVQEAEKRAKKKERMATSRGRRNSAMSQEGARTTVIDNGTTVVDNDTTSIGDGAALADDGTSLIDNGKKNGKNGRKNGKTNGTDATATKEDQAEPVPESVAVDDTSTETLASGHGTPDALAAEAPPEEDGPPKVEEHVALAEPEPTAPVASVAKAKEVEEPPEEMVEDPMASIFAQFADAAIPQEVVPRRHAKARTDPAGPRTVTVDSYLGRHVEVKTEELTEDEAEQWEEEEEETDSDEDVPMIKRRRGAEDAVVFKMETGGGDKDKVSCGLKNVAVSLGGRGVLQDASWVISTGEKLGFVGANGCGKTTQLRVLTGELEPEEGEIFMSRPGLKIATLTQSFVDELDLTRPLREELFSAIPGALEVVKGLARVRKAIDEIDGESEEKTKLTEELADLQVKVEEYRIFELETRMEQIINMMRFSPGDLDTEVQYFSGGWKVRIGLAKIFMTAPDILVLDEPTNHLDMNSVGWLEKLIRMQNLPIAFVSHDREFIEQVATRVVDTVEGMTYSYPGNYSAYLNQREFKMEQWRRKYTLQEKRVNELQTFIKENKNVQALANARNNKQSELDKLLESPDYLDPPPKYARRIQFRFPEPPRAARGTRERQTVAFLRDVTHGYGDATDKLLLQEASLTIKPGDKIGIVGPNGSGKSTLLRLLMGVEEPSGGGKVMPPDPRHVCYFTQHQADLLPPEKTALQVVKEGNQVFLDEEGILEIMKKFRFRGDRLQTKVKVLSGGEKARLAIVRMMLQESSILIFDEPTNHLDIPMKETLEYSMREYKGAVVVVSHDRWFLSNTCRKMVAIEDGQVVTYNGDYRYYMDKNRRVRKAVEKHYMKGTNGIDSVPETEDELRAANRGGLKKNYYKRKSQARKMEKQAVFARAKSADGE